jgi:hypothetical protein
MIKSHIPFFIQSGIDIDRSFSDPSVKVRPDTRILGMNPDRDRNHNEIACSQAGPLLHPINHSSRRLLQCLRWSCDRLAFQARLGRSFPLKRFLTCRSFLLGQPTSCFVYITIKSTPWQPAPYNKSPPSPSRLHQTHPTFSSLTINFYHIIIFSTSQGTQAGAALFTASAFAHPSPQEQSLYMTEVSNPTQCPRSHTILI